MPGAFASVTNLAPDAFHQLGRFGWLCCLAFLNLAARGVWHVLTCRAWRPGASKFFVGMPTPAAAGVIASIVHAFHEGDRCRIGNGLCRGLLLAVALGGLMTSTIRYYSFKDLPWSKKQPGVLILLLLILGAVVWLYSELTALDCRLHLRCGRSCSASRSLRAAALWFRAQLLPDSMATPLASRRIVHRRRVLTSWHGIEVTPRREPLRRVRFPPRRRGKPLPAF